MQKQSKFRYWMGLISLGYMGGTMYLLLYVRYVFYDQMIGVMNCTNAQLGLLNSAAAAIGTIVAIPGAYLADKWDAKFTIVRSIGLITLITFIFPLVMHSYTMALILFAAQSCVRIGYWPSLVKYINGIGDEEVAGNSFGVYYLINGLSGAFGNVVPLWIAQRGTGMIGAIITMGVITLIATILVAIFLDSEKKLKAQGRSLKGDEPIELRHIKYVLKWPGTYMIFIAYFTTYTIYSNVSYFNPFLIDVVGVNPDASSVFSIIRSYGAMLVAPLGGIMADKVFKSTSTWYIVAFSISAVMFVIPLLFGPDSNPTMVSIYSVLPSLVIFALYSVTYSILRELHIPATVAGTAIGLGSISGNLVDGVLPPVFGALIDNFGNTGYTLIFTLLVINCMLGIANALWVKSHNKKCLAGTRKLDLKGLRSKAASFDGSDDDGAA